MLALLAFVAAPALAQDTGPACEIAANRLLDFILSDLPDNEAGAAVTETMRRDGRQAVVENLAAGFTYDQCAFLMMAPDSTVQAVAKTITGG